MLSRRTFMKTVVAAGTTLTLGPLVIEAKNEAPVCQVAPKNKPPEWISIMDLLPPIGEPVLISQNSPKCNRKYVWAQFDRTHILEKKSIHIRTLYTDSFVVTRSAAKNPAAIKNVFHKNSGLIPDDLLSMDMIQTTIGPNEHPDGKWSHLYSDAKWITVRELLTLPMSQDLSLLKPGEEIVIVKTAVKFKVRNEQESNKDEDILVLFPFSVKYLTLYGIPNINPDGEPLESIDGHSYIGGTLGYYTDLNMRVDGNRSWIILPKV